MAAFSLRRFAILGVVLGLAIGSGCEHSRSGSSVTKANADKIQVGMTESEVVAILGAPTASEETALPEMVAHSWRVAAGRREVAECRIAEKGQAVDLERWGQSHFRGVCRRQGCHRLVQGRDSGDGQDRNGNQNGTLSKIHHYRRHAVHTDRLFHSDRQRGRSRQLRDPLRELAPNVELSGPDANCVLIAENKPTGFKWKGVGKTTFNGAVTWTAKGIKATKIPEGGTSSNNNRTFNPGD